MDNAKHWINLALASKEEGDMEQTVHFLFLAVEALEKETATKEIKKCAPRKHVWNNSLECSKCGELQF